MISCSCCVSIRDYLSVLDPENLMSRFQVFSKSLRDFTEHVDSWRYSRDPEAIGEAGSEHVIDR